MDANTTTNSSVAIIGAGLSGLVAARRLRESGVGAVVFDKGRGVGGRMSTRRSPTGARFDHGAQYFTVRDERFRTQLNDWLDAGMAAKWEGQIAVIENGSIAVSPILRDRYVGVPGMNAICKHLARDIDVRCEVRVAAVERVGDAWRLVDDNGAALGAFGRVLCTAPAPQTAELFAAAAAIAEPASSVDMHKCWAVMAQFEQPLSPEFDGAFVNDGPLSWIARDSSKPGRERPDGGECWVLHGSQAYSAANIERNAEEIADELLAAFFAAAQIEPAATRQLAAHRWRYSAPEEPLASRFLRDEAIGAYAAGDWCGGPRVEGAYLSGLAAAEAMLGLA
ncbi:MAG: FAD-dependent oxidoreductase [Planctomycetaceae bacterium]|nr:FAD-dependent oxidoreductase [Planctomycetaceae bacterium]